MRSKFIISSLVAFIAAVGLMAAPAMAEVKVAGEVKASFGQTSVVPNEGDTKSELTARGEANLNVSGGEGALTGKFRLRIREDNNALAAARHVVSWGAAENLKINISGSGFGIGNTCGFSGTGFSRDYTGPSGAASCFGESAAMFEVNYNLGTMNVGLGIVPDCTVDCPEVGAAVDADGDAVDGRYAKQTMIPNFGGKFGPIQLEIALASSSGSTSGGDSVDAGSKTQLGVKYGADFGSAALDYSTTTIGDGDASSIMRIGAKIGLSANTLHVGYGTTDNGAKTTTSGIRLGYQMPVGSGSVGPVYESKSTDADGSTSSSSYIYLATAVSL